VLLRAARGAGLGALDRVGMLKSMIVEEAAGLTGDTPKMVRGELV
jgi:2-octaprenyl-6-methoxyphenol hydroxylase